MYLRFIPAYFAASVFQSPTLQATCNNIFSYIGQPFGYLLAPRLALNPKATNGADVTNYQLGDFWRYDSSWPARTYSDTNTSELISFDEDAASVGRFTDPNNASVVQLNSEQITYTKGVSPINSFSANLQLTLGASDITDQDNVCYKTADSNSTSDCLGISFNSDNAMQLYWGRLLINDSYGSELSAEAKARTSILQTATSLSLIRQMLVQTLVASPTFLLFRAITRLSPVAARRRLWLMPP